MTAPGSGEVRWPLTNYVLGRGLWDSGYHQGVDLLAPQGQPIFAAAAGVVSVSQESYGGYGVAIVIEHVINGQKVSTTYGHMTYGSRQVQAGQTVAAGQLIGLVGSTGSSTANHLHFEVHINGRSSTPTPGSSRTRAEPASQTRAGGDRSPTRRLSFPIGPTPACRSGLACQRRPKNPEGSR